MTRRFDQLWLRFGLWLLPHTTRWRNANMSYTLNRVGDDHMLTMAFTDKTGTLVKDDRERFRAWHRQGAHCCRRALDAGARHTRPA